MSDELDLTAFQEAATKGFATSTINVTEKMLADPAFRKRATPDEIRAILSLKYEIEYSSLLDPMPRRPLPRVQIGFALPHPGVAAAALFAAGAAAIGVSGSRDLAKKKATPGNTAPYVPTRYETALALQQTAKKLLEKVVQIAQRSTPVQATGAVKALLGQAMAGGTMLGVIAGVAMAATSLDTLGKLLGFPPGQLKALSKGTLDAIRVAIAALLAGSVPPHCKSLLDNYNTWLKRANNAVSGTGFRSNSESIWAEFVKAALALVRCLKGNDGGPGSAPA